MSARVDEWHRSEPRAVRPFFSAKAAEEAVYGSTIQLSEGAEPSGETLFNLDEFELRKLAITVKPILADAKGWLPDGYTAKDFNLVVVARNSLIKRSIVLANDLASSFHGKAVELLPEQTEEMGGGRNLRLTVALCLNSDKPPKTGSPFVVGHWLSSKTFTIREKSLATYFDVRSRTDKEWEEAGYPAKTFYSVEYSTGISDEPADESSTGIAVVYIHVDAYNRMAGGERIGDVLQPILTVEILAQILEQSRDDWIQLSEITKGSPLETFTKELKGTDLATLDGLKSTIEKPYLLRAILQSKWNVLSAVTSG